MKVEEKYNATEQKYLYNLSFNGCYIGFALEKNVFKKLMKLNAKYTAEVKEILKENILNIHFQDWTLNSKEFREKVGQHSTRYVPKDEELYRSKEEHIDFFKIDNPKRERYFINVTRDEATELLDFELEQC